MPNMQTGRHKLPYLAVSQAQKEITHNEALTLIDALLHPVVESQQATPPIPTDADIGKCWLVGASPVAEWSGKGGQMACWIGGGWRYWVPSEGARIRRADAGADLVRSAGQWVAPTTVGDPTGGSVIDVEARQAIAALLSHFRMIGQITP